jgi:hypothetical protein
MTDRIRNRGDNGLILEVRAERRGRTEEQEDTDRLTQYLVGFVAAGSANP